MKWSTSFKPLILGRVCHSRMLLAGIQAEFGLDPRLKHSGVTVLGSRISSPSPKFSKEYHEGFRFICFDFVLFMVNLMFHSSQVAAQFSAGIADHATAARIASTMRSSRGPMYSSNGGLKGTGTSRVETRRMRVFNLSKPLSAMRAAISAATPQL